MNYWLRQKGLGADALTPTPDMLTALTTGESIPIWAWVALAGFVGLAFMRSSRRG
jgi:hypothetical protein